MYEIQKYDEEIYEKVCKENKEFLEDYILEMKSRKLKEKTIYQYAADIKLFFCYSYNEFKNKPIIKLKRKQFRRFFIDYQETDVSNARINRVQCSLRNFLAYLTSDEDVVDEYEVEVNYMDKIKGLVKEEVREIIFLSDEEIRILINKLIEKKEYQKALLVAISYESGGRRNEIYQVTKDSLLDESNNKTNELVGKRGKQFQLRYFSKTKEIFKLYLEQRGNDNEPYLWYKKDKSGITEVGYTTLYQWIIDCRQVLEEATGEHKLFNNHSFRHCNAENLLNGSHYILQELGREKLDLAEIKLLLHHSSSSTTETYVVNTDAKEEEELFGL